MENADIAPETRESFRGASGGGESRRPDDALALG